MNSAHVLLWQRTDRRVLAALVGIISLFLIPAIFHARRLVRDEQRITDLTEIKQRFERYYNAHNSFPPTRPDTPRACAFSHHDDTDPLWGKTALFRGDSSLPQEARRGWFPYAYCPTSTEDVGETSQVTGFFLQATLEEARSPQRGFDREEGRNFRYRVFHDGGWTFYRICGGTDPSCGHATASSPLEAR